MKDKTKLFGKDNITLSANSISDALEEIEKSISELEQIERKQYIENCYKETGLIRLTNAIQVIATEIKVIYENDNDGKKSIEKILNQRGYYI